MDEFATGVQNFGEAIYSEVEMYTVNGMLTEVW